MRSHVVSSPAHAGRRFDLAPFEARLSRPSKAAKSSANCGENLTANWAARCIDYADFEAYIPPFAAISRRTTIGQRVYVGEVSMYRIAWIGFFAAASLLLAVAPASAQGTSAASVSGVVTDSSGAVLPGVTVEATSPVLIEKSRTAVTDERGEYRIVELLPGTYTVTFTLPGFASFRREELQLPPSFNADDQRTNENWRPRGKRDRLRRLAARGHADRHASDGAAQGAA